MTKGRVVVTPFAGVWIEIYYKEVKAKARGVTPFAGVWIEIFMVYLSEHLHVSSLPSRECGLKSFSAIRPTGESQRHSLRGSVD